jgi:hypothetical protein
MRQTADTKVMKWDNNAKVHAAKPAKPSSVATLHRLTVVACTGRAMSDMVTVDLTTEITCKACAKHWA